MSKPSPKTFRSIIELWSSRKAMADDIGNGLTANMVGKWERRDSIPAEWWSAVCSTGLAKAAGVTTDLMARLAAVELKAREPAEARP